MGKKDIELARRGDAALAAIMGVDDFGRDSFAGEFNGDGYGYDFGFDFGADPSAMRGALGGGSSAMSALAQQYGGNLNMRTSLPAPAVAAVQQIVAQHAETQAITRQRRRMIEPNAGSAVKIEKYAFSVTAALVLGTASNINASQSPDVNIRPQRVTSNAPQPNFVLLDEIKVANVSATIGGQQDAFDYNALAVDSDLDLPTLTPANRARILGDYTGLVPPGYAATDPFTFIMSFKGPATIVA